MAQEEGNTQGGPKYHSKFGGLWIDREDADAILQERYERRQLSRSLYDQIRLFMRDGYVVVRAAVPKRLTQQLRDELEAIYISPPEGMLVENVHKGKRHLVPPSPEVRDGSTKLLDLHAFSEAARRAVASPPVLDFLTAIFEGQPKAFQSLSFWNGSQQPIHKDTAYVQIDGAPMHIVATWLALEDIAPGTGELEYYVGSHRAPDFLFGGEHKWMERAPHDHGRFLASLHEDAEKYAFERSSFLGEEGDVLIWHADLAHGGSPITTPNKTRKSLVTHFTRADKQPPYNATGSQVPFEQDGCLFIAQALNRTKAWSKTPLQSRAWKDVSERA